jgi:cell division septation protein DedD
MTDERTEYEVIDAEPVSAPPPRKKPMARWALPAALLAVVVAGIVAWAVIGTGPVEEEGPPPLVAAPEGPDKVAPDDPGGLDVPDQDKLVYEAMTAEIEAEEPEHLLPAAEEPAEEALAAEPDPAQSALDDAQGADAVLEDVPVSTGLEPAADELAAEMPAAAPEPAPVVEVQPEPEPVPEPAVVANAPGGDYFLQIGSFREESVARAEAERLKALHTDIAGSLAISVQRADLGEDKGIFYRARYGAFASREVADALCAQLKARKQDCLVVKK